MNKIPVYFMPGMAANSLIFERIKLNETLFNVHYLEWEIPKPQESLVDYAKRIALKITEKNPVLIGVSFGGILVQEIADLMEVRKVIIISSVKSRSELPKRIKFAKSTLAHKLIPMRLILRLNKLAKLVLAEKVKHRIQLYDTFLSVRDIYYLKWAVEKVVLWDRLVANERVIHIHGDKDRIFPIQNIKNCIVIKGGTHVAVYTKYRWFNTHLSDIILGENPKL
ncbi:alpha/beta hydrolase [Flavobacterium flevense]|uniref:Alpha/beta hydrolase n=1 Tax=Flavobacterium flevense TaxID=983 RepID=A0A4Y4AX55_9FLAO|nr:alpha/beta hydrolase [Flavobacterium flevense]GEC71869.1 alpha/beta hydrolase [Flavobacterium flevense]